MNADTQDPSHPSIEQHERRNKLRVRAGGTLTDPQGGQIDPDLIAAADDLIRETCSSCDIEMKECVDQMVAIAHHLDPKEPDMAERKHQLFCLTMQLKDMAGMCHFKLISDFSLSLQNFLDESPLDQPPHLVILKAHADAIALAFRQGITDHGGPAGRELKAMIAKAIDKYKAPE